MMEELAVRDEAVPATMESLILRAIEQKIDVEGLERLLAMKERVDAANAKQAFLEALSAFQGECPTVPKTKTAQVKDENGRLKYTYNYARIDAIVETVAPVLFKHGLSFRFDTAFEPEPYPALLVVCTIAHRAGHSESSTFRSPIDQGAKMNVMQRSGSARTYGMRYALCDALGIVSGDEDDDAQGTAGGRGPAARGSSAAPPPPPPAAPEPTPVFTDPKEHARQQPRTGVGPQPRRQNVVELPPQPPAQPPPVRGPTAEDVADAEQPASEPTPDFEEFDRRMVGEEQSRLDFWRAEARLAAAMLFQLRVVERNREIEAQNKRRALMNQPQVSLGVVPDSKPSTDSNARLATYVTSAFPGQTLEQLDEESLKVLLQTLGKMSEQVTQKLAEASAG
jgi:hypothetical protein